MSPTGTTDEPLGFSYGPPPLSRAEVVDVMRLGLITCPQDASVSEVARMMATYRVHCVLVEKSDAAGDRPWGVISDVDLMRAARDGEQRSAAEIARTQLVTIAADEPVTRALELMSEHDVSHLVVVQGHSGQPVGVLSTLDVAGVIAWGK